MPAITDERGINPGVGAVIAIIVVVCLGWLGFTYFGALLARTDVLAQGDILTNPTATLVSATVKNIGGTRIENCTVTIYADDNVLVVLDIGAIDSGNTGSASVTNPSATFSGGVSYSATVHAVATNGVTVTKNFSILAR